MRPRPSHSPPLPALLALATAALAAATPAAAFGAQVQIGLRVEYYELDHLTAYALATEPTDTIDATGLRNEVLSKVALGEARLADSAYVVTRSGQRAKAESIVEVIYPTEFDPPETPQELEGPVASSTTVTSPITPTAFETRNVGLTFEVDPVIGADGTTVDLNCASEIVTYLGDTPHGQSEAQLHQPVFHTIKDSTAISLRSGSWALLGIHHPPPATASAEPPADRRVLALVRAEIIYAGSAATNSRAALEALVEFEAAAAKTIANRGHGGELAEVDDAELAKLLLDEWAWASRFPTPLHKHILAQGAQRLTAVLEKARTVNADAPGKTDPAPEPGDPFADGGSEANPDPHGPTPSQIAIHYHWYQLPALAATRLLDEYASDPFSDATELRGRLDGLVTGGHATLVDSAYVATRSGQRAKSESIKEWIYPTEMDPPEIPQKLTGPIDPGASIITHLSYTAFETRNVGTTLEVDPVIGPDGLTIDLNMAPEIVRLGATRHVGVRQSRAEQPVFHTVKTSTATTLHSGTSLLVGMHTPMPEDVLAPNFGSEQRILTIAAVRILKTE